MQSAQFFLFLTIVGGGCTRKNVDLQTCPVGVAGGGNGETYLVEGKMF